MVPEELLKGLLSTAMSTWYQMSGSTPVISKVNGAFQVRRITWPRDSLLRLLTTSSRPTENCKKVIRKEIPYIKSTPIYSKTSNNAPSIEWITTVQQLYHLHPIHGTNTFLNTEKSISLNWTLVSPRLAFTNTKLNTSLHPPCNSLYIMQMLVTTLVR